MQVNHFLMKRVFVIFLLLSIIAIIFSSCERNCYCKNLKDGTEGIYYGAYSKKECREAEEFYNSYQQDSYECTYK